VTQRRSSPSPRPASLRGALVALARDEAVALLMLWLVLAVPVACQHGPMGLLLLGSHSLHTAAGHVGTHHVAGASSDAPRWGPGTHEVRSGFEEIGTLLFALTTLVLPATSTLTLGSLAVAVLLLLFRPPARPRLAPPDQPPRTLLLAA
jgi:hypothetical protein